MSVTGMWPFSGRILVCFAASCGFEKGKVKEAEAKKTGKHFVEMKEKSIFASLFKGKAKWCL